MFQPGMDGLSVYRIPPSTQVERFLNLGGLDFTQLMELKIP